MRKASRYDKMVHGIELLHQISLGNTPVNKYQQITNLANHGFIVIHPGRQLELTPKGQVKAKAFSEDKEVFRKNVQELMKPKEQKASLGTMPLFYEGCKVCDEGVELHKAWVKADLEAIRNGGERPAEPIYRKHKHGI